MGRVNSVAVMVQWEFVDGSGRRRSLRIVTNRHHERPAAGFIFRFVSLGPEVRNPPPINRCVCLCVCVCLCTLVCIEGAVYYS